MVVVTYFPKTAITQANYLAVDYSNGIGWDQVNCSQWSIAGGSSTVQSGGAAGAMELVLNPQGFNTTELWIGPSGSGPFLRSKSTAAGDDADLYSDGEDGGPIGRLGIAWEYRSCALPKVFREVMNYAAVSPRIRGNGTLGAIASTLDHKYTQDLAPIVAEAAPGEWPLLGMDVQAETLHVEIDNYNVNGDPVAGAFGIIAGWKVWWTLLWEQRG